MIKRAFGTNALESFYLNLNRESLRLIENERLKELFEISKKLNNFYNHDILKVHKSEAYYNVSKFLRYNIHNYKIYSRAEKYVVFMFAVDPTFEAIKIYSESNKVCEMKNKMISTFGMFDEKLIILEKEIIGKILSKEKKEELEEFLFKNSFK